MRDGDGNTRKQKRAAFAEIEEAIDGAAVRQAYLRHIDEQQLWAGFTAQPPRSESTARPKPSGRPSR